MKDKRHYYIFVFFLGAILGWCGEVIFNLVVHDKLINPGTLFLCWCPIYGVAVVIIDLITKREYKLGINAIIIATVSTIDEYLAAVISEEIFNHQLWDYSTHKFNFQGRVCLDMTLLFTLLGLLATYIFFTQTKEIYKKNYILINKVNYALLMIFILNIVVECII